MKMLLEVITWKKVYFLNDTGQIKMDFFFFGYHPFVSLSWEEALLNLDFQKWFEK